MRNGYGPDWSYRYGQLPRRRLAFPNLGLVVGMMLLIFVGWAALGSVVFMAWILSGAK